MADLFSPMKFDEAQCKVKAAGTGDAIDPKHILVDPDSDNILTNDPATGLKVVAEDFISAEEGNIAKASQADGGVLVKATDMVSDAECNALSVTNDGKLALIPEDLISDVMGGNPLGINPDDCKLYINPCLLPGPQNIVSKDEDNLIVEDPEDCSALLKYRNVVSEDAGNLIQPGTDGKLMVDMQYMVDRGYYGAGLVYVEKQDGSHVLQVAACDGLKFEEGDVTDTYGNTYHAKWLVINLDESQNILYFKDADGCAECFTDCKQLSLEFSLDATGTKLRILDRNGTVYRQINLSNGLQGDGNGGLTINTLDSLATTAPNNDLPVSSKAVKEALDGLRDELIPHAHATTKFGAGTDTLYGHVKLSDATNSNLGVGDGTAATPKAVKKAYDDGTRTGNGTTQGQVKLSASHTSDLGVGDGTAATPSAVKKAYDDGTRTGNSATQGQVKLSDATDSNLGVSDGTAATPKAVKTAYDAGTRKGTCSQFGQVKLTDSLTSTDDCADSVGLSAAAGKSLQDQIDELKEGGGTLKRYPLYATEFVPSGNNNSDHYIFGKVVAPNFGNSSTRFTSFIYPVIQVDHTGDSSGQLSWEIRDHAPCVVTNLARGGQASVYNVHLSGGGNEWYDNGDPQPAGVALWMITHSQAEMAQVAAALNALAPIPLPALAKYVSSHTGSGTTWTYYFGIAHYGTGLADIPKRLSEFQLNHSYATVVEPDVNVLSL